MEIVAITDIHGKIKELELLEKAVSSADILFLCGDITHFGKEKEIKEIIDILKQYNSNIIAVTGNCDHHEVEKYLVYNGISVNCRIKETDEFYITGLSGSLPCPGTTPNEYSEEEYEAVLEAINIPDDKPLVMLTHQPPHKTKNDKVFLGLHTGSRAIRKFIEMKKPLVCFTGHIHEGTGIDHIGPTAIVNPGPAGKGNYAYAQIENKVLLTLDIKNIN